MGKPLPLSHLISSSTKEGSVIAMLLGIMDHISNNIKVLNKLINVKHSEKVICCYVLIGAMCAEVLVLGFRNSWLHIWDKFLHLSGVSKVLKGSVPAS